NELYGFFINQRVICSFHLKVNFCPAQSFRYGGEEFLILLQDSSIENAQKWAKKVCKKISELQIKTNDKRIIQITASFGISRITTDIKVEETVDQADRALYRAKESGRNCVKEWGD
ncbi:MAG: hypothetical protein COY58_04185, partial [Gammaproteobacteria bacterium CG_4_10_14_0_8_um_filter_38_16]